MKVAALSGIVTDLSVAGADACWHWPHGVDRDGYGRVRVADRTGTAHRAVFELTRGQIPAGLTLDHLCHSADGSCAGGNACLHRRCINPSHLEAVTHRTNSQRQYAARKTHCVNGHPFDLANTYIMRSGGRSCRRCTADQQRAYQLRRRVAS